jgi:hypothetical protein
MLYVFIAILAIMEFFLLAVGIFQLKLSRDLALRISYIDGTTDLIFQSQEHINKMFVAFSERVG